MIKKIFDLTFASFCLIISFPILLLISLLVKIDSKGPILFKQKRIGINGKPFILYKFRTMILNAELIGPEITKNNDNRITKFGNFLRKYKLDELPQLINILKLEMSFVGPRPEVWKYKDLFKGKYKKILDYVPGLFGPSQVAHRNESEFYPTDEDIESLYIKYLFPIKAEKDLFYFKSANCIKDIKWILKGVWATIFRG